MFNPRNPAHLAHLRTPAQGSEFYRTCKADQTVHGIRIPGYAVHIAIWFTKDQLAPTASAFKG